MRSLHYAARLEPIAHYLAALLLDQKSEVPIPAGAGYTFGTFAVLEGQPDSDLRKTTAGFLAFRNVLRVLYGSVPLDAVLRRHGDHVQAYGERLLSLCAADIELCDRLQGQEQDVRRFAQAAPEEPFSHSLDLLKELAERREWDELRDHSSRLMRVSDPALAMRARRFLALAMGHSDEHADKESAIGHYGALATDPSAEPGDFGNQALLQLELGEKEQSKRLTLEGLRRFPQQGSYFYVIGQKIVAETGDKDFRKILTDAFAERKKA